MISSTCFEGRKGRDCKITWACETEVHRSEGKYVEAEELKICTQIWDGLTRESLGTVFYEEDKMWTVHSYQLHILHAEIMATVPYGSKNTCLLSRDFQEMNAILLCYHCMHFS